MHVLHVLYHVFHVIGGYRKQNYSNPRQIDKIFKNNIKDMEEIHRAKQECY